MLKTRVAIIGAGAIGRAHIKTVLDSQLAELVGIADPMDSGKAFADGLGVRWYVDYRKLLDSEKPDAAIIATPNDTHRAVAIACIERGVAAIVEKPIASSIEDANAIILASRKSGVPILVGHHRRYNPIVRRAKEVISKGILGRLTNATVLYTFYKPPEYFNLDWRRKPGGGPILINLIHEIDLVRHLCGEIASVQAITSGAIRKFEVEDTAAILLRLENNTLVTLSLSDTAVAPWSWDLAAGENPNYPPQPLPVQTHFICGTDGSLTLPTLEHWKYTGEKSWFEPISQEVEKIEQASPYTEQLRHLCKVVRGEEIPLINAEDGTQTLRATLAVHKAAQTGQTVVLD